jgi:hypothetical protein
VGGGGWGGREQHAVALGGGSVVDEEDAKPKRADVKLQLYEDDNKSTKLKLQKAKDAAKAAEAKAASIHAMTQVRGGPMVDLYGCW